MSAAFDLASEVSAVTRAYIAANGIGITEPGVYTMPADDYHADPCAVPSLSSGIARTLIARSPLHAWTDHPRLNPHYRSSESAAFDLGSAAHALLLEGEDRMAVIDAADYRTKAAQEARDAARQAGRHPVLAVKYRDVKAMVSRVHEAIDRSPDLAGITLADGRAEQVMIWREGEAWCRARVDWMSSARDLILEYKTTAASANPLDWTKTMSGMGGEFQASFYLRGNAATGGDERARWIFLVQEHEPPYAVSLCGLAPGFVALGESKVRQAIREWSECMRSNAWPAYSPRVHWLEPPPWEFSRWEERQLAHGIPYDPSQLWEKPQ